jgi:hypothetical protein
MIRLARDVPLITPSFLPPFLLISCFAQNPFLRVVEVCRYDYRLEDYVVGEAELSI